jgi:hypothetical protein
MGKLWIFGDSNSALCVNDTMKTQKWMKEYIDYLGHEPKHFSQVLAELLGLELKNFGIGGSDNYTIIESVYNVINEFNKEEDVIFIGLTEHSRFRIADSKLDYFHPITAGGYKTYLPVSKDTLDEMLVNRMHVLFAKEFEMYVNLLKKALDGYKLYFWTVFDPLREAKGVINVMKLGYLYRKGNITCITQETDEKIVDGHFGEKGNILLGELFYTFMNETRVPYIKDIYNETRIIKFI